MRVGAFAKGLLAAPDVIWSWGFNCDEGPKTDEMIQGITGKKWKYHVSRVPHDSSFDEREDLMEANTALPKLKELTDRAGVSAPSSVTADYLLEEMMQVR